MSKAKVEVAISCFAHFTLPLNVLTVDTLSYNLTENFSPKALKFSPHYQHVNCMNKTYCFETYNLW